MNEVRNNQGTTFSDLIRYLPEENSPIDEESIGVDNNITDYTVNSSISEEESSGARVAGVQDISLDEMIARSNEIPEFYSGQIEFEPIKGLPGAQQSQLEHKQKSILKNKYWGKLLKNAYEIGTAKIPKPEHLNKILSLFIANQEKIQEKKEEQEDAKQIEKTKKEKYTQGHKNTRIVIRSPKSAYRKLSAVNVLRKKSLLALLNSKGNLTKIHAASTEVKKRIDKLEKITKYKVEELAIQTKNALIRMPPYKKEDVPLDNDPSFFKLLNKCIFSEGLINKWKSS